MVGLHTTYTCPHLRSGHVVDMYMSQAYTWWERAKTAGVICGCAEHSWLYAGVAYEYNFCVYMAFCLTSTCPEHVFCY